MDVLSSKDGCVRFDNNLLLSMDYDSGYMSHNPESNFDSSLESSNDNYIKRDEPERPVYLSEDALLETPIIRKDAETNFSLVGENGNYEQTRELLKTLDTDVVIPSSVLSQENCLSLSGSEADSYSLETDLSVEVSPAKPIIFDSRSLRCSLPLNSVRNLPILDGKNNINSLSSEPPNSFVNSASKNSLICSLPMESIMKMNIPATSDPKKKLILIISKASENAYSVKRKFRSLSPEKDVLSHKVENVELLPHALIKDGFCEVSNVSSTTLAGYIEPEQSSVDSDLLLPVELGSEDSEIRKIDTLTAIENNSESTQFVPSSLGLKKEKPRSSNFDEQSKELSKPFPYPTPCVSPPKSSPKSEVNVRKDTSLTPMKTYVNTVNPYVSPDLFSDHETSPETTKITSRSSNYIAKEQYICKKDERILRRTQNSLKGVLPPRSVTVLQLSLAEMLNQLDSNKEYFWTNSADCETTNKEESLLNSSGESSLAGGSKSLLVNGTMEEAKISKFPDILKQRNFGLYHNRSKLSEEFEELCVKFGERYVGAETQSTCTVFEVNNNSSPRKRFGGIVASKPRWAAKSPGRRLSHLARRRITFSSANLQASGSLSSAGSKSRQILVDAKKFDVLNIRRSPRKTPKKTPSKSPRKRTRTPSSSAKKKLAQRFRSLAGEIEGSGESSSQPNPITSHSKRALFSSPDKKNKNASFLSTSFSQPATFETESFSINTKPAKRALFNSPNKKSPFRNLSVSRSPFKRLDILCERKRKRDEDLDEMTQSQQPSKIQRSMSMDVVKPTTTTADAHRLQSSLCRTKSDGILSAKPPLQEMSAVHKKKLQWAVYEALRAQNVTPAHAQFKVFASVLARVVRRLLNHLSSGSSAPLVGSTSERMLRFAKRHSLAVVKGASVEEVIGEYTRMRLKLQKPQGYVGIEEFKALKDKENHIRNRPRTLESLEKRKLEELQKPRIVGDNRIERIRKVINFGDDVR